jgi:hypothetical protein
LQALTIRALRLRRADRRYAGEKRTRQSKDQSHRSP